MRFLMDKRSRWLATIMADYFVFSGTFVVVYRFRPISRVEFRGLRLLGRRCRLGLNKIISFLNVVF